MAGLHLSHKESKNNSKDINYRNSNLSSSPIPQEEESNNEKNSNNAKPLAKLLVVDNDSAIVQVLKLGLQKNRFLVNSFTNPEEALQSFKSNAEAYCLLLSDIRMPSLSGIQQQEKSKRLIPW
jgi:PleD family two-component response regulator